MLDALRTGWPGRIFGLLWFGVDLVAACTLGSLLVVIITNIRMYYGPWANPPGDMAIWYALVVVGAAFAVWRAVRRWRRTPEGATRWSTPAD